MNVYFSYFKSAKNFESNYFKIRFEYAHFKRFNKPQFLWHIFSYDAAIFTISRVFLNF